MKVKQNGKALDAVIVGSWNVNPGFRLGGQATAAGVVSRHRGRLSQDVRGAEEASVRHLPGRARRVLQHARQAHARGEGRRVAWIDPAGYKAAVAEREKAFEAELKKQQKAASAVQ